MIDNNIGMHIYRIKQHISRKSTTIEFKNSGDGARFKNMLPDFISRFSNPMNEEGDQARAWYFEPKTDNDGTHHGVIHYGSSGYESKIVDRKTRDLRFQRAVSDMDVIPLYHRFWVPSSGDLALVALQTFGQRSCVSRVLSSLEARYRASFAGHRLTFAAVMPMEFSSLRESEVTSITLMKSNYSSDIAANQFGIPNNLIEYDVCFTAKPKKILVNFATLLICLSARKRIQQLSILTEQALMKPKLS